ncbi:hypothetical protein C8Q79DRAFT_1012469 [Trametes meyenii]|nr:hypothetical protein C8Q79DRAFT_1012469 [Trametes meyenii]
MSDIRQHEIVVIHLDAPSFGTALKRHAWDAVFKSAALGGPSVNPEDVRAMLNAVVEPPPDPSLDPDTGALLQPELPSVANTKASEGVHTAAAHLGAMSLVDRRGQTVPPGRTVASEGSSPRVIGRTSPHVLSPDSRPSVSGLPRHLGTYADVNRRLEDSSQSMKAQVYTMTIQMNQALTPYQKGVLGVSTYISNSRLVVDTGSIDSWVFGDQYLQLLPGGDEIRNWDSTDGFSDYAWTDVIMNHDYSNDPDSGRPLGLDPKAITGQVKYQDGTRALLTLMREKRDLIFPQAYDWAITSRKSRFRLGYRLGVAYAVTDIVRERKVGGVLGFGLGRWQIAYLAPDLRGGEASDSFPAALIDSDGLHTPETGERGIIFYFIMRLSGRSYLAFNLWPFPGAEKTPHWSLEIPVVQDGPSYSVCLTNISFLQYSKSSGTWHILDRKEYGVRLGPYQLESPVNVLLDTGASVSWMPASMVNYIRRHIYGHKSNIDLADRKGDTGLLTDPEPPYRVARGTTPDQWRIRFTFKGRNNIPVQVDCPETPFLYNNVLPEGLKGRWYDGLVHTSPWQTYILGLNFFQSMFVSMHNQDPANAREAYVRLAPQTPEFAGLEPPERGY